MDHVAVCCLHDPPAAVAATPLSKDEQASLTACRTARRRREVDVSRRLMRYGLREHLDGTGDRLSWGGKGPRYEGSRGLWLSAAHGGCHAAVAWSGAGAIGVDIEDLSGRPRWRRIMRAMFCDDDIRWITRRGFSDERDGLRRFLAVWTAREAHAKYTGGAVLDRLSTPLLREPGAGDTSDGGARVEVISDGSWVAAVCRPLRYPMPACILARPGASGSAAPWRADYAFIAGDGH